MKIISFIIALFLIKITYQSQILNIENQKNQTHFKDPLKLNQTGILGEKNNSEKNLFRDINNYKIKKNQIKSLKITSNESIVEKITRKLIQEQFKNKGENGEIYKTKLEKKTKILKNNNYLKKSIKIQDPIITRLKRKLTQDNSDSKNCNMNFTRKIFGEDSEITSQGIPSEKGITDLCPLIKISCCSLENLKQSFSDITDQILNVYNREKGYLEDFIETTKKINEENIKNFFNDDSGNVQICLNLSSEADIKKLFLDLKDNQLYKDIIDYRNMIYREAYASVCSMCNSENHMFFGINDNGMFTIKIQEPEEFYFYFRKLILFKKLINLEKLDNLYRCIDEDETEQDPLKNLKKIFPDFIKTGKEEGIKTDKNVKKYIKEFYAPGNSNFYLFGSLNQKLKKLLFKDELDENVRNSNYLVVPFDDKASSFLRSNLEISFDKKGYTLMGYKLIDNDYFKNMRKIGVDFEYENEFIVKFWIFTVLIFLF